MRVFFWAGIPALLASIAVYAEAQEHSYAVFENIEYTSKPNYPDNKDKLDIYIPEDAASAPVLVFVHGGALIRGDKAGQKHVGKRFTRDGFVTVCVNHRLSPGVMHPAHAEDVAASFAWVVRNIARYGGDPEKIFLAGHSAGGYLVALVALDAKYLNHHELSPDNIRGVVPISGFFHVDRLAPSRPKHVWGTDEDVWRYASPATYLSKDAPPMLFLYADHDAEARRKESEDIALKLTVMGHPKASTREIYDRNHTTIWQRLNQKDDETSRRVVEFMRSILAGS